ncbi:MAG: glycosyltransferase family 2 protein, partial [Bacteroidaceae bacterium]|nr:glycosyltransferase family 2 protein [Bacteroidaceae bacterium]
MTKGLVSIIVAAYNAESLLPRCLDSLISQTYRKLEIIVINDASTDNTQEVIDAYRARDSRIIALGMPVISGAPAARKEGMKLTSGEFMTMVDA